MTSHRSLVRLLFAAATLLAGIAAPLPAQGAWSPHFDLPGFGIAGRVFGLGTWRNELVACTYRSPWRDGARLNHVAHFDGVRWQAFGAGVNDAVRAALEFQGDLYVAGRFTTAGGVAARGVARWDGAQWQAVGAGLDGEVWSLCEHQGELYAGGQFDLSGGQPVNGIARWTGSQWAPVGGGLQWQLGLYECARTLLSDGTDLYVGGDFDRAGTVPASYVARWDGAQWHPLGGGIDNFGWAMIWKLERYQGRIYCGGIFGQAGGVPSENLAAWDGTLWHAVDGGLHGTSYGPAVHDLCVHGGDLYVGGHFTHSDSTTGLFGIARWDGAQFHSIGGVAIAEVNPPAVFALESWNGRLYAGGEFQAAGADPLNPPTLRAVYHVASWDGTQWAHAGDGLGLGNEVHVLGSYQGQVIAGGRFVLAGGNFTSPVARFDGDDWVLMGTFDGLVTDMCEHNGELWVAGEFFMVNGQVANGVARWDGTQWHTVGGGPGLHRAYCIESYQGTIHVGSVGSPKRWNGSQWQSFASVTGAITTMHVHNGVLFLGGSTPFHPGAPNLFAWDGSSLTVPGGGVNDSVEGLGSWNGELIVGGRFTQAGGNPARSIARWNGTSWSTFGGIGIQGWTVKAITTFQGQLVIGGDFSTFAGAAADYVARWTGSAWAPIVPGAQPDGTIYALLADDARGELYAGGWYGSIGTADAGYLGVHQVTPYWTDVGAPLATPRRAPKLTGDGRLLPGSRTRWRLSSAQENSIAVFAFGFAPVNLPIFGGTLVPSPDVTAAVLTDGIGSATVQLVWPGPLPGYQLWAQAWTLDPAMPQGLSASNGVRLRAP